MTKENPPHNRKEVSPFTAIAFGTAIGASIASLAFFSARETRKTIEEIGDDLRKASDTLSGEIRALGDLDVQALQPPTAAPLDSAAAELRALRKDIKAFGEAFAANVDAVRDDLRKQGEIIRQSAGAPTSPASLNRPGPQ